MSFPRYPKYKDSGVEWLGEVPEHWEVEQTKRLFRLVAESAPDDNNCELLSIYTEIGVRPRKDLEAKGNKATTTDGYWKVQKGDLIVNKLLAWMGAIGISEYDGVTSPAYDILRKVQPLEPQFYDYLFRCGICFTEFRRYSRGIMDMRLRLYFEDFGQLRMPFPPIEDQRQIISFLDHETSKIDSLVAEQRRLIELLKEKRQAVISHAVTKGLNPHAPMKPSGIEWLGDVPEHWRVTKVKYATVMTADCPHETPEYSDEGEYLVIRTADVENGRLVDGAMYRVAKAEYHHRIRRSSLEMSDIVYTREGERWGLAARIPVSGRYCLGQRMFQLRAADHFSPDFLMWHLCANCVYGQAEVDTVGATAPHVNLSTIRNFVLASPPREEQQVIAAFVGTETAMLDSLTTEAERAIELLQERRTALISAAVTGKIDVRNLVEAN